MILCRGSCLFKTNRLSRKFLDINYSNSTQKLPTESSQDKTSKIIGKHVPEKYKLPEKRENLEKPEILKIPKKRTTFKFVLKTLFGKYLLLTNVISSGILMVIGDFWAQKVEIWENKTERAKTLWEKLGLRKTNPPEHSIDTERMWQMFAVGSLQGPLHHYGYKWICYMYPGRILIHTLKKILFDQLVMSPLCIVLFFYPACFLEHKPISKATQELIAKFPYIYTVDWCTWPILQFINFHYLKAKYHVIFVNVVTALYNIFLSYVKHGE